MEDGRIAKRVHKVEGAGSRSVGRPRKIYLFYYGLTSIYDLMVDTMIIS